MPRPAPDREGRARSHVSERQLGAATIWTVRSARMTLADWFAEGSDWLVEGTEVDATGRRVVDVNSMFVRVGEVTLVVDPSSWVDDDVWIRQAVGPDLLLDAAGVSAEEVTHVAVTHGHVDHYNGLLDASGAPRFPNAEHLFPEADWEIAGTQDRQGLELVERAGLLRRVRGDHTVSPHVHLDHAPGETAGHQVVRIEAGAAPVFYLGDLVHFPVEFEHTDWAPHPYCDVPQLERSRRRLFGEAEASGASLVFTHARFPAWGTVERRRDAGWRWLPTPCGRETWADGPAP